MKTVCCSRSATSRACPRLPSSCSRMPTGSTRWPPTRDALRKISSVRPASSLTTSASTTASSGRLPNAPQVNPPDACAFKEQQIVQTVVLSSKHQCCAHWLKRFSMKLKLTIASLAAATVLLPAAHGQTTGTSHPEQLDDQITTSPAPSSAPHYVKPSPAIPAPVPAEPRTALQPAEPAPAAECHARARARTGRRRPPPADTVW